MKKSLLFLTAVLCCTMAFGNVSPVDSVPYPAYMKNMSYDPETRTLSFEDRFQYGREIRRDNAILAYLLPDDQTPLFMYVYNDMAPSDNGYFLGYEISDGKYHEITQFGEYSTGIRTSKGGATAVNISDLIDTCMTQGVKKVRFVIRSYYIDEVSRLPLSYQTYSRGPWRGESLNDYLDVELPDVLIDIRGNKTQTVNYQGNPVELKVDVKGLHAMTCRWQRRNHKHDGTEWYYTSSHRANGAGSVYQQYVSANEARNGKTINYYHSVDVIGERSYLLRLEVTDETTYEKYYSNEVEIRVRYPFVCGASGMEECTSEHLLGRAPDCREHRYISELPVLRRELADGYTIVTMPECPLTIEIYQPDYEVSFYDSDATLLSTEMVPAGEDATPPEMNGSNAPACVREKVASGRTFIGWSKDYTNVHGRMQVFAKYEVNVNLDINMQAHTTSYNDDWLFQANDHDYFQKSATKALAGDQMTFRTYVHTNTPVNVYFQVGQVMSNGEINWNNGQYVGKLTGSTGNQDGYFDYTETALYTAHQEMTFENKRFYRFYASGNEFSGRIYSEAMEIDAYYPLLVKADQVVFAHTADHYFYESRSIIPVRYGDTLIIEDLNGYKGAGLNMALEHYPASRLTEGTNDGGFHYVLGIGNSDSLLVTTQQMRVIFEVPGAGGSQMQYVPYGGSAVAPEDPVREGDIFIGWQPWSDEYTNEGYYNVTIDMMGFTADFDPIPVPPTYTVIFKDWNGTTLSTQTIEEGQNAVAPTVPDLTGYHFTGWDNNFNTVSSDLIITAQYGQDEITHVVIYRDYDNTELYRDTVLDGMAANSLTPYREGYTFIGWSESVSAVTANMTVIAQYEITTYTIRFYADEEKLNLLAETKVPVNGTVTYPNETPVQNATAEKTYTFTGWSPELTTATANADYVAVFQENARTYTVIFQDWNHDLLSEQAVAYGTAAQAPAQPTKEGYTFVGWDRDFAEIKTDITVTAVYVKGENVEDAIEDIHNIQIEKAQKMMINGHIYIVLPNGDVFNAQGNRMK